MSTQYFDDNFSITGSSPTPEGALVIVSHEESAVDSLDHPDWRPILSDSHQVVLYNSNSHALSVRPHSAAPPAPILDSCPYCNRPLDVNHNDLPFFENDQHTRASNYFQLLEVANETSSRPPSRGTSQFSSVESSSNVQEQPKSEGGGEGFRSNAMAEGYFEAFFKEEYRLGMGANGSVFLCQVGYDSILLYISNC